MRNVDDVVRYKKKAVHKSVKKCGHKHVFTPCVIEYPKEWWQKEHLRSGVYIPVLATYCTICGRVGEHASLMFRSCSYTEEERAELDPKTRTLPTFRCEDSFAKFVDLSQIS